MALHLPHHLAFIEVKDAGPAAEYARSYFASDPGFTAGVETIPGIDGVGPASLRLADREAVLARVSPNAAAALLDEERRLLRAAARQWHLPPGETVVSASVSALSDPFAGCPAGTVVVVRETDRATVGFLLPHLFVDLATGAFQRCPPPPAPAPAAPGGHRFRAAATGGSEVARLGLQFAATLSFALPPPFGPVVSGVFGLLGALVPNEAQRSLPGAVVEAIERAQKQRDLGAWMRQSADLVKWCREQIDVMKGSPPDVQPVEPTVQKIVGEFLPVLRNNLSPGGTSLYDALESVASEDYINERGALDVLMLCVSAYLFGLRFKLTLEAYVASQADPDSEEFQRWNQDWRYDYVLFRNAILGGQSTQGWAPRVAQLVERRKSARLSKVLAVQRGSYTTVGSCQRGGSCETVRHDYWTFEDRALTPQENAQHRRLDYDTSNSHTEYKDDVERARAQHVASVARDLDDQYADALRTVEKWRDSIHQWDEHLPPVTAPATIKVGGFTVADPAGGPWAGARKVRYAVAFANQAPGPRSEWSARFDCAGKGSPTLVDIPVDGLGQATSRTIWRVIDDGHPTPVLKIPDNVTRTAVDDRR